MATTSIPLSSVPVATAGSPVVSNPSAQIIAWQLGVNRPQPSKLKLITSGISVPPSMASRLSSFPEEIYSLQPNDNLVKFLKVLIGATGAGQTRTKAIRARLSQFLQGANFYDLDSFYGNVFGLTRLSVENLPLNPYRDLGTYDTWSAIASIDATYRSRIDQFARAISLGPSPIGIQLIAEAVLQMRCQVYESWVAADNPGNTVANVQTLGTPVSVLAGYTNLALQTGVPGSGLAVNRRTFTVVPFQSITREQAFALQQVLDKLKPANALAIINTQGFGAYEPIQFRGVRADSSYWQVAESVIPNPQFASAYSLSSIPDANGYFEVLRPPYSEYQGEEIIYNSDIIGSVAYNLDDEGNSLPGSNIGTFTFLDGVTISYPPTNAIASRFYNLAGRLVSDGILQGAAYSDNATFLSPADIAKATGTGGTPNTVGTVYPVTLYADGMALAELVNIIQSPGTSTFLGVHPGMEHYWATPSRVSFDPTPEVLEFRLKSPRLINNLRFELAHFPQNAQLQYYDATDNSWKTLWSTIIRDSIPAIFPAATPIEHINPQHDYPNHWDRMSVDFDSITTDRMRLVLVRITPSSPPITQSIPIGHLPGVQGVINASAPYSLGVQNLVAEYIINEESDLPVTPIFTSDAFGSQVEWTTRQEPAENATNGGPIPWRSSPQPSTTSVVNFFADTRDRTGAGQLIDQFYIDPLYMNSHCTLYFSNDNTADLGFAADATNLIPPVAKNIGTLIPSIYGMDWPVSDPAAITIDNKAIQFDPAQPWWCGVVFNPNYGSNQIVAASPTIYQMLPPTIWDFGNGLNLTLQPGHGLDALVTLTCDSLTSTKSITFGSNDTVYIVVAYIPNGSGEFQKGLYLFATTNLTEAEELTANIGGIMLQDTVHPIFDSINTQSDIQAYLNPATMGTPQPTLSFGRSLSSSVPANMNLVSVVLKQEVATQEGVNTYGQNYSEYTQVNPFLGIDPSGNTTNALLRFNPVFIKGTNISGFIGGPGNIYSLLNWTPVTRDFIVSKGFMQLPPTLAKYWKFEFTNLTACAINTFIPINGSINTHQGLSESVAQTPPMSMLGTPGAGPPGTSTAIMLPTSQTLRFTDQPRPQSNNPPNPNITPPTATQIAPDITTQLLLAETSSAWQYQEWHANPHSATRFVRTGIHNYQTAEMSQNSQVGFFAGLNSLQAFKLDFSKSYDAEIYDSFFWDETNIASNSWQQNPNDLNTFGLVTFPRTAVSTVMYSTTPVSGLQFATSQNDAIQLAYDDDFQSGAMQSIKWTNVLADKDTSMVNLIGDAQAIYDVDTFSVQVYRNSNQPPAVITGRSTDGARLVAPEVHPIFDQHYLTPIDITNQLINSGGISSAWCAPAASGTIWGAVRVTANTFLDQPLQLQIVDAGSSPSFTPTVLATHTFTPAAGQTVEETIGYQLGSVMATGNPVYVQIVQTGNANNNEFTVHRLSLFDEGIIWQFSNNGGTSWYTAFGIRNNCLGQLTFPTPGNALMWKAIGTRPNVHINGLRIRPVYTIDLTTVPQGILQGPNLSLYDHCPPILEDPLFNGWSNPGPYWWFANNQDYPLLGISGVPNVNAFSKFYVRQATDTIALGGDTVSTMILHVRDESESLVTGDIGSRTLFLNRSTSETTTVSDSAIAVKINKPGNTPMVRPDVAPVGDGS